MNSLIRAVVMAAVFAWGGTTGFAHKNHDASVVSHKAHYVTIGELIRLATAGQRVCEKATYWNDKLYSVDASAANRVKTCADLVMATRVDISVSAEDIANWGE